MTRLPQSKYDENGRPIKKGLASLFSNNTTNRKVLTTTTYSSKYKSYENSNGSNNSGILQEYKELLNKEQFDNIKTFIDEELNTTKTEYDRRDQLTPMILGALSIFMPGFGIIFVTIVLFGFSEQKLKRKLTPMEQMGRKLALIGLLVNLFYFLIDF